ncbi:MAG: AmmeMemoRadiSam system protein A [Succinivibrio sp.]|nr:AmmeMemoRadiSam system protein A [Succinivibrio sp.]
MPFTAAIAVPHPPIILPEIGKGEEQKIAATAAAYRQAMEFLARDKPDTVVILSPHSILYADYFHISPGAAAHGDMSRFRAPQVSFDVAYDTDLVASLSAVCKERGIAAGTLGERDPSLDHGTMVPLYFLRQVLPEAKIVRIGLSRLSPFEHYEFGRALRQSADLSKQRVALIASGDLSHKLLAEGPYGFAPEGPEYDEAIMRTLGAGDFLGVLRLSPQLCESAAECGQGSFMIMAGVFDRQAVVCQALSHEGTFGVGYGVVTCEGKGEDAGRNFGEQLKALEAREAQERRAREDEYVRLARLSVETYVRTGQGAALPSELSAELTSRRAGAFVSLKKHGQLRGCIGTIVATTPNVASEILQNGISACSRDPRFPPVTPQELDALVYSVDVLGEHEPTTVEGLDVKRYGVIVESGGKRGLLLPDLDGVDTVEQQIDIARQKAGIPPGAPLSLFRFEVIKHT